MYLPSVCGAGTLEPPGLAVRKVPDPHAESWSDNSVGPRSFLEKAHFQPGTYHFLLPEGPHFPTEAPF